MGSTITTGKQAAVLIKDDGTKVFALFEKTHESNVTPHTPRWSCIGIGEYNDVLLNIFKGAVSCEGGGLQGTGSRHIQPENYIAAWLREMASPAMLADKRITLSVGEWGCSITPNRLSEVVEILNSLGRNDLANSLNLGERVFIHLHADIEIVLAIYGVDKIESTWRVIDGNFFTTLTYPELGQEKRTGKIDPHAVKVLAVDQYKPHDRQNRLVKIGDKPWKNAGWQYSAVQNYILDVAYPCELIHTGSAKALISEFREQCKSAESVSGDVEITFIRCEESDEVHKWNIENLDKLAGMLGCGHAAIAPDTFTRKLSTIRDTPDALCLFSYLKQVQYVWQIDAPLMQSALPLSQCQQMDLLAA